MEVNDTNAKDLSSLYKSITKDAGKPLDYWELAALLEIYGIRDVDAKDEYGFENVFEMAKYMQRYIDIKTYPVKAMSNMEELPPFWTRIFKNYIRGLAFAMPMFVQIFFTLSIGYAIWSSIDVDKTTATAIALGTFMALIVTGASAQAIGRKGLFYIKQEEMVLASNVTRVLFNTGLFFVIVVGVILAMFNFFFDILPTYYFYVLIVFYLLLSFLFLNVSIYYMFEEYMKILYFFLFGMIFVYFTHGVFKIKLPEAQFLALVMLDIIIGIFAYKKINDLRNKNETSEGEATPRASILFFSLFPFYMYGFMYFLFLVSDRIVAWSTSVVARPYFIWFDVPYELGLDWALIALIFLMGFTEISIHEFMYRMNDMIIKYEFKDYKKFNKEVYAFYKKFNLIYIILSIVVILLTYLSLYLFRYIADNKLVNMFFDSYTPFVFWIASISYAFVVHGLMNVLFIFSLSRQHFSLRAITVGALTNIIVGIILSRMFGLEFAVLGLLVGSLVFWAFSYSYALRMFKKLEYYYYSTF